MEEGRDYIVRKIQKIAIESSNVKHLSKVLESIINNRDENISATSIATLSGVLTRSACALSNQINNLSLRLEK